MLNLTAQQIKVFDVIKESLQSNGYPPTRAEIAKILDFKSVNAAESHIKALVKKGVIEKVPGSSRGIKLVDNFWNDYKKIYDEEFNKNGYFKIIKRSPLYICKKKI